MMLGSQPPKFGHIPVATNSQGQKLSKQHHAKPLDLNQPLQNLYDALSFLNLTVPREITDSQHGVQQLLDWAVDHWHRELVAGKDKIIVDNRFY